MSMTVAELITELQTLPGDHQFLRVWVEVKAEGQNDYKTEDELAVASVSRQGTEAVITLTEALSVDGPE